MIQQNEFLQSVFDWLNSNQGVLAVAIFLITAALMYIFSRKRGNDSVKVSANVLNNSPVVVGNNNIVVNFPDASKMDKMITESERNLKSTLEMALEKNTDSGFKGGDKPTEDFLKVKQIMNSGYTAEKFSALRALFYSAHDKYASLQAVLVLVNWFDIRKHKSDDFIELCDQGIQIAEKVNAIAERAILLAYKGYFVSLKFVLLDIEGAFNVKFTNSTGIPFITEKEREKVIKEVQYLDNLSEECFRESERLAIESRNYNALGSVYIHIGNAAGQRFPYLDKFGLQRAQDEKNLCKRAFHLAKEIYAKANDERELGYVFHNFANQLRNFDEKEEAKTLIAKAQAIAKKYKDLNLSKMSDGLLQRIESGIIPDYLRGDS